VLVLCACVLEFFPLFDRSDPNRFIEADRTDFGFPFSYLTIGFQSTQVDFGALLEDFLAVGFLVVVFTCWNERWSRNRDTMRRWNNLRPRSWILLGVLVLMGLLVQRITFVLDYAWTNYTDKVLGVPFAYYRVHHVSDNEPRTTFDSTFLAFDLLLIAVGIAEVTYWFERSERKRLFANRTHEQNNGQHTTDNGQIVQLS